MIIHTSQLNIVEDIETLLAKYKVKPIKIKGQKLSFYWPPQPVGLPLDLLKYFPQDMYVVFKGRNTLIVVP